LLKIKGGYIIPPMGIIRMLAFILVLAMNIEARPISYSGGSTLMVKSDNLSKFYLLSLLSFF
jgi:hypothetical protein